MLKKNEDFRKNQHLQHIFYNHLIISLKNSKKMNELSVLRSILALGFVVGLILMGSYLLRRFGGNFLANFTGKQQENKQLKIKEQLYLDPKRRIILLNCNESPYLLLLGAQSEQMIALPPSSLNPSPLQEETLDV
jgi:flagellar biogenesis protein FliO